jgi:hypothetical protein
MDRMDIPEGLETTGRYIVTLRDGAEGEAMAMFADQAGIKSSSVMMSSDFEGRGVEMSEVDPQGGLILQNIGIAVLNAPPEAANELAFAAEESAAILAVEPEGVMYAIQEGLTLDYLRGFSDATARLLKAAEDDSSIALIDSEAMLSFADTAQLTWGLQATKVAKSKYLMGPASGSPCWIPACSSNTRISRGGRSLAAPSSPASLVSMMATAMGRIAPAPPAA